MRTNTKRAAKPARTKALPSTTAPAKSTAVSVATSERIRVTTQISRKCLRAFQFYSQSYEVPVNLLLQAEAYGQAGTIDDDPFGMLEFMEEVLGHHDLEEVTLEFCPEAHAILIRLAELLRWPLPEFLHGLLDLGGFVLDDHIKDALSQDGIFGWDMECWAEAAMKFERLAKQNKTQGSDEPTDGWDSFNITRPEKRAARLKLKGGAA